MTKDNIKKIAVELVDEVLDELKNYPDIIPLSCEFRIKCIDKRCNAIVIVKNKNKND